MVISGNYRWLLGLRPRPHQGGCSSPLDPRLLPGSMLRIDMAWPPGKHRFQRPLLKSSSGSKGCCGTGFRTLVCAMRAVGRPGGSQATAICVQLLSKHHSCDIAVFLVLGTVQNKCSLQYLEDLVCAMRAVGREGGSQATRRQSGDSYLRSAPIQTSFL